MTAVGILKKGIAFVTTGSMSRQGERAVIYEDEEKRIHTCFNGIQELQSS